MREPGELWKLRERALERASRAAHRGDPEGLHDLRVALRRLSATASALNERRLARDAKALARSLSSDRQIQVDRQLLARVGKLGFLSPDAVTALAARWEKLATRGERRIAKAAAGPPLRAMRKRLDRLSGKGNKQAVARLEQARRRAEEILTRSLEGKDDAALHRYRIAVKKARYLAEDLAALGLRRFAPHVEREKALQEAFGRWNDLRMFCRRLVVSRDEAEERGAIALAAELEQLLAALEPAIGSIRREAVEASRMPEPVPLVPKAAGRR